MQTKNYTFLIGRIGADPESKEIKEKVLTTFSLATEETWKDGSGEKKSATEWHNVEMWGNKNLVKYLKKGTGIWVEGRNRTSSYDKKVGGEKVKMYKTSVVVNEIGLLDSSKKE